MLQALHAVGMLKDLTGKLFTVANGHLSYEIDDASSELLPVIGQLLQSEFGFAPTAGPAIGLSEVVVELEIAGIKVGLGWDNWSGAYVMAFTDEGDQYIKKIASFLNTELEQPKYRRYGST